MRVIITLILVAIVLVFVDGLAGETIVNKGEILEKHYKAKSSSVGSGTSVGSDGSVGVVTISETDPEKFIAIVRKSNGDIVSVECDPKLYFDKEIGDQLVFKSYVGFFSGAVWSRKAEK